VVMVRIYVLIDPRNKQPFYVGSTRQPLERRLSMHICESNLRLIPRCNPESPAIKRMVLIKEILKGGDRPLIKTMFLVDRSTATKYEKACHDLLLDAGYMLIQSPTSFIRNNQG